MVIVPLVLCVAVFLLLFSYKYLSQADNDKPLSLGKWFEASDEIPDFISEWSFQRSPQGDNEGWKPKKQDRPDLWIRPEDSFVLTLNSAEIIPSESMSAGLCLRFPRITSIRAQGFDKGPKPHDEVQTFTELSTMYIEKEDDHDPMEFDSQANLHSSRFMTAKQLESSWKQKKQTKSRKQNAEVMAFSIPEVDSLLSHALDGLIFTVLPGTYHLESDSFAAAEAEENGWAEEAKTVASREDVVRFVKSHGGKCELSSHTGSDFILGGTLEDPKVAIYQDLISATNENDIMFTTTKRDAQVSHSQSVGKRLFYIQLFPHRSVDNIRLVVSSKWEVSFCGIEWKSCFQRYNITTFFIIRYY
jgi:hypothetical protein